MLKYQDTLVTFTEVPDEISLCFNIANCPCGCQGCFEPWLAEDRGEPLTTASVQRELLKHPHITCICWMGGDREPETLATLTTTLRRIFPHLKFAMYSGRAQGVPALYEALDYYKIGPYMPAFGPLNRRTTNQRFYKKVKNEWLDITSKFQKEEK